MSNKLEPQTLTLPVGHDKLLLHSCCAPCFGEVMETLIESGIDFSIFFYNSNIHPVKEYEIRKEENIHFAEKHNIPFIDCDYDTDNGFARAKCMENEPEKGIRCTMCFDMRFERTALYAAEHGFSLISSSLGISRWKNMKQINDCGHRSASHYEGISYWDIKLILLALKHLYYSELILFTFQLISVLQPKLDRLIHRHPFQFYKCH